MQTTLCTRIVSSLEKCFADEALETKPILERISVLRGEQLSFQLAYTETDPACQRSLTPCLSGDLACCTAIRRVDSIPSTMPVYKGLTDDNYLRTEPGLFPDLLRPIDGGTVSPEPGMLDALWLTVEIPDTFPAGEHVIAVALCDEDGEIVSRNFLRVTLIDAALPEQELIFTQWFHSDCLAHYYGVEVFSERYWEIVENYVRTAAANGINLLLTPVFTPPLDTAVDGERLTVQLVGVTLDDGKYSFDFTLLDRWIEMCNRCGIKYLEIAHFFTQWGAAHAPKIMAAVDGEYRRIFGWDTDATGEEYTTFLRAFIPALLAHLRARGDDRRCFFHVSDEPQESQFEQYRASAAIVKELLQGYPVMDALSSFEFYRHGVIENPIPSTNHIEPFLEAGIENLWTYYCCGQVKEVSNRFFAMPSARTRIIGLQLYKFNIAGFLHWGYNFYASRYSLKQIDPYTETTGCGWVPSGDAFSVYPAPDGSAWESLRIILFREALADMRALRLCEQLCGRDTVLALMEGELESPITFSSYPHDAAYLLKLRERINAAIAAALA
ncbi:MAG: DUF4091 domain-containing protein [Clostridia bacterium]|nr:DUF4091 domain-containing protein [Clostridia bacterium]